MSLSPPGSSHPAVRHDSNVTASGRERRQRIILAAARVSSTLTVPSGACRDIYALRKPHGASLTAGGMGGRGAGLKTAPTGRILSPVKTLIRLFILVVLIALAVPVPAIQIPQTRREFVEAVAGGARLGEDGDVRRRAGASARSTRSSRSES